MIPDLGAYAVEVSLAYLVSFVVIGALVWSTLRANSKTKRELDEAEGRWRNE